MSLNLKFQHYGGLGLGRGSIGRQSHPAAGETCHARPNPTLLSACRPLLSCRPKLDVHGGAWLSSHNLESKANPNPNIVVAGLFLLPRASSSGFVVDWSRGSGLARQVLAHSSDLPCRGPLQLFGALCCAEDATTECWLSHTEAGLVSVSLLIPGLETSCCGSGCLFSMGKMHAMLLHYGVPAVYYTVSPNDVDNKLPTSSLVLLQIRACQFSNLYFW